ncbi:ParA family protein [Bacillus swezeyi]|uniref:ParA family protein n=1 Tax=Bacillus swezeyi TaxID=1925020 RepID=UPI00123C5457|nr:ParA family protein [Bacillus swezeyi]KAA6482208.1 ParA family protein [Bacillus swezeyi]
MEKKATVVSFLNMKGGVGKTTLCINIAYTLVKHFSKKVLLIDMDPQFNASQSLMTKYYDTEKYFALKQEGKTVIKIFENNFSLITSEEKEVKENKLTTNLEDGFDLVLGDLDLIKVESGQRGSENLLRDFVESDEILYAYDYILIDCPPTHSFYTSASLITSNYYLAPLKPDVYSFLGVELLKYVVSNVNRLYKCNVKPLGVVFTMINNSLTRQSQIVTALKDRYSKQMKFFKQDSNEYEYISSGKIETFMYDMLRTKKEIINITKEFIEEIDNHE